MYDNVDRLTGMTNGTATESYAFNAVGSRTASHRSSTYGCQPFNRLTSTAAANYSYDANGNMIRKFEWGGKRWTYIWDYESRLARATNHKQTVRYIYDALGRRVQRYIAGGKENTKFIYDGSDVLVDDNSGVLTKYLNNEGIDEKLRVQTGSNVSYFLSDHLGSTNGLVDSSSNLSSQTAYDSFGNQTSSLNTRYGFTGRERDDLTGLLYYRARFYDPNLGRFISEDPIGFAGGDVNLFAYVGNNPANKIDPLGESEESKIWRLQYHADPATRPYVAKWESCQSKCIATHIAVQAAGFMGTVFGQPMDPKRFVTPGSSPATSPISRTLSRILPQKLPFRVWAPTWQHPFSASANAGRVVGRWVPYVAPAVMAADFYLIWSCTNECYDNECRK